jgi:polyisoprenoid-binding protein YceI
MAVEKWNFDPVHSHVSFSVRHLMISKVHGHFRSWTGTLLIDEDAPENSSVAVEIDAASIDTKEPQRDDHLRSADFLDVAKYPKITFRSTGVARLDPQHYRLTGDFTVHGVTREVVLEVEFLGRAKDPWGGERAGFSASTAIERKDYGLTFNIPLDGGGVTVGDKVNITLEIEAVREAAAAA